MSCSRSSSARCSAWRSNDWPTSRCAAAPSLAVLITAIGVSYFLQNAALLVWTSNPKSFSSVVTGGAISLFGGQLQISRVTLVTVFACVVIMVALMLFTGKSKVGTAMRAVSEDKGAAQLMGINVNTTISITFAIGSGLAAIAGVLLCSAYPTLMPTTGSLPGIKAFTAAVFGGIGSIPGAFVGGVLLGIIEIFSQGVHFHPAVRRDRVRRADRGTARQAGRPAGQARERERFRGRHWI